MKTHPEFSDVSCSIWQDNNIVPMLTTIHSGDQFIIRLRRRPRDTSTSAVVTQTPFIRNSTILADQELQFDPYRRALPIPIQIDDYNSYMNGCDIADQLRAWFKTQRQSNRSWWPLFYFLLDHSIINAYLLQQWFL